MTNINIINANGKRQSYPSQIPDLYKIATHPEVAELKWGSGESCADQIIKSWHMLHDMKDALLGDNMAHFDGWQGEDGINHVREIMGHQLLQMLHWCNCADLQDGHNMNDLNAKCANDHEAYGHIAAALKSLGFNRAREIYSSEGDIETAHGELDDLCRQRSAREVA